MSIIAADGANLVKKEWTDRIREILDTTRFDNNEKRLRVLVEREVERLEKYEFSE